MSEESDRPTAFARLHRAHRMSGDSRAQKNCRFWPVSAHLEPCFLSWRDFLSPTGAKRPRCSAATALATILELTLRFNRLNISRIVGTASLLHSGSPMKKRIFPGRLAIPLLIAHATAAFAVEPIADIDPRGQGEGRDGLNWQRDMRARLFRERNPEAFRILTDTNPPVLAKVPSDLTKQEAGRIMARALTVGEDEFKQANGLIGSGKNDEAISAFERLRKEYPATWIDRRSEERLARLKTRDPVEDRPPDFTNRPKS